MKTSLSASRALAIFLIGSVLLLSSGCSTTQDLIVEELPSAISKKSLIVHHGADRWYIPVCEINDQILTGKVEVYDQRFEQSSVHIYISPLPTMEFVLGQEATVPLNSIAKIETHDFDAGKTILFLIGAPILIYLVALGLVLLLKQSCPFIYTYNGESYTFAGEIYSGAVHPPLERHDYLRLPELQPDDGEYRIQIANRVKEIQHTNLMELQVYDHPAETEVLLDRRGVPHSLAAMQSPVSAIAPGGCSVLKEVTACDSLVYISDLYTEDAPMLDEVLLTFDRPPEVATAKLVVRAKNSFWLDYMYGEFAALFGDRFSEWQEKQKTRPEEQLRQWSLDQGIPLSLYMDNGGEWEFVDFYHVAGPMAYRDDLLAFELPVDGSGQLRLKLVAGRFFWEIDRIAIDYSDDLELQPTLPPLLSAIDHNGCDVHRLISQDDDLYLDQPEIGDETTIIWKVPATVAGMSRTAVLHSRGHYEIIRNPSGRIDREQLLTFREPEAFIRFSNNRLLELYHLTGN